MISSTLVIFTSNLAQALGAIVLAMILTGFHRTYGRRYLLTWARSWWAFCVSQAGGAVALLIYSSHLGVPLPLRLAISTAGLAAGYWQAALLLFGTWEVVTERELPARLRTAVLGGLALLAVIVTVTSLSLSPYLREVARVGLRLLLQGVAFVVASWGVWRSHRAPSGIGRRMVAFSFLLFGLHQLHYLAIVVVQNFVTGSLSYVAYLGPFDFLFQALIGLGMVVWLLEDERQRVLATADRIEHLAYHDPLTDLPNRNLLVQSLQAVLAGAEARGERMAVLFLDLDRFKIVNESLGNRSGDELLRSVAERLRTSLGGTGLLARVAADEFAVLMPTVEGEAALFRMAEKLLAIVRLPFALQGREIYLTASLGISRFPEDGGDAETLLKRAEIAMYRAKGTRRDDYQVFTASMDSNTLEQLALEADLRKALAAREPGELVLFYQPVLDSERRVFEGVEALLRWRHPVRGLMTPGEFLWLADVSGLAVPLDLWVLRQACREIQEWREAGARELRLAVNLSPRSFQQPDLLQRIQGVLAETGLPPFSLELEITETLAMHNAGATLGMLRTLKDLGVRIAIDDFGTGYSSLSYLTTFPIDTLKVDRSFVHTLGRGHGSEEVAAAVIALAVSLGLGVIAEGVETREQWRWLEGLGCDRFQGYLFSPPLPAFECREMILHGSVEERIRRAEFLMTGTEG